MKVAVIGSWRKRPPDGWEPLSREEDFQIACIHIGSLIAKWNLTLLVPRIHDEESAEFYAYKGFCKRYSGIDEGVEAVDEYGAFQTRGAAHILAVHAADIVILIGGTEAAYNSAISAIETRRKLLIIPAFGGAARALLRRFPRPDYVELRLPKDWTLGDSWLPYLIKQIEEHLLSYPRLLIIHGRARDRLVLKKIICDFQFPGLPEPIIMNEHGHGCPEISDLFETLARRVDAAIVLVTPDDMGKAFLDEFGEAISKPKPPLRFRARQNVWLEVGWFWAALGFDRLLILVKKDAEIPSDFSGLLCTKYMSNLNEVETKVRSFIEKLRSGK